MVKLEKISFCGKNFGHSNWHSHTNNCEICYKEYNKLKINEESIKLNWVKKCDCGCGAITKYNNNFVIGHGLKGKKQNSEHKSNRLTSWVKNGNVEKYSDRFKENNPSTSELNRKRLKENNPSKTSEVKKKISDNNGMKFKKNIDKILNTKLERYGNSNYNNHEKFKETFLLKYGVDNPAKIKEMLEKRINTEEWFDSSYEQLKMIDFNNRGINWTKKHGIKIPFVKLNGLKSFYVPDFMLISNLKKIIVEVKGWIKKDDILKADAAKDWCNENGYEYYFLLGKNFELVDGLSVIGDNKNII